MLYALQIPPQGGDTRFTNQRAAYQALSDEMKDTIADLRAVHVYLSKYSPRKMPTRTKEEEALKAVTLYPAQILGVGDRLGSIEKGKTANLVVTDGSAGSGEWPVRLRS